MSDSLVDQIHLGAVKRVHFQRDSITQGGGFLSQQQSYVQFLAENLS